MRLQHGEEEQDKLTINLSDGALRMACSQKIDAHAARMASNALLLHAPPPVTAQTQMSWKIASWPFQPLPWAGPEKTPVSHGTGCATTQGRMPLQGLRCLGHEHLLQSCFTASHPFAAHLTPRRWFQKMELKWLPFETSIAIFGRLRHCSGQPCSTGKIKRRQSIGDACTSGSSNLSSRLGKENEKIVWFGTPSLQSLTASMRALPGPATPQKLKAASMHALCFADMATLTPASTAAMAMFP